MLFYYYSSLIIILSVNVINCSYRIGVILNGVSPGGGYTFPLFLRCMLYCRLEEIT